ncbi:MAG: hypothetical protein ABSB78_14820, partial [Bacteroidota bacterium]
MAGKVSINNMHIFIGGQIPGPTGVGNFVNTSSYHTIADGFITMNGNNEIPDGQTVAGAGSFGNFEVDVDSIVTVEPSTGPFTAIFGLTKGRVYGGTDVRFDTLKFNGTWPTIRRNAGTFDSAPTFVTMVNVIYIGVDKTSSNELPVATDKLWNLTVSTTNGLQAGAAGKGTVQVTVPTTVNGKINVYPGQALELYDADIYMKGDSIILNGDIASYGMEDELWLRRATGTIIKGAGVLPNTHVDTGSVGNVIDGAKGIAMYLLGSNGWRGGGDDSIPGCAGLLVVGNYNLTPPAGITLKFGAPNSSSKAHIGCFDYVGWFPGLMVRPAGTVTLAADLVVRGISQYGTINLDGYTLTDRSVSSFFGNRSVTTGSSAGVLRFEPDDIFGAPSVKTPPVDAKRSAGREEFAAKYIPKNLPAAKRTMSDVEMKSLKSPTATLTVSWQWLDLYGVSDTIVTINTNVTLASSANLPTVRGILEQYNDFKITGNVRLDSLTRWDMEDTLTLTGQTIRVAKGCKFWTSGSALHLNPSTPPLIYTTNNNPEEITNLIVSNSVKITGGTFEIVNLLHDGGVLDYSDPDIRIDLTFTRRGNSSYNCGNNWFIFAGTTFDQDTTDMTLVNLSFESTGASALINKGIVNVSNKLRVAATDNYAVDINNTPPTAGATRLAVANQDTVIYIGGRFDFKPVYAGTITLITELTTTKQIHETVWPSNSAALVDTLIIDNIGSGVKSYMPTTPRRYRQINNSLELRVGILSLDGDTLNLPDTLTIRRRQTGSLDLDGGTIPWHWTNVVYEPTAASPDGNISTGPELLSPVNNLTITKYGTPAPGNALITLTRDLVVNGTLRVANNFSMGTHTLELDGHMIVTAPQLTFNGT